MFVFEIGMLMAIKNTIQYAELDQFRLDPMNPRFGRIFGDDEPTPKRILDEMEDWKLDELAVSFLSSGGFWVQEAVLVLPEKIGKKNILTVVEGNRRIAALIKLKAVIESDITIKSAKWRQIAALAESSPPSKALFAKIPYLSIDDRKDVDEFLGFRHVTGIEEWQPAEKAAYIAKLVDERSMTFEQVMRKIGSKTQTVRQNYATYRLFRQMEDAGVLPDEGVQNRFSVLYLSLRTPGVQKRLGIDLQAMPKKTGYPVPKNKQDMLDHFARWIFGDAKIPPLFSDSRKTDEFGRILESDRAYEYLRDNKDARFEQARVLAGGDLPETISNIKKASEHIRLALAQAHLYQTDEKLLVAMNEFGKDAVQLMSVFKQHKDEFSRLAKEAFGL